MIEGIKSISFIRKSLGKSEFKIVNDNGLYIYIKNKKIEISKEEMLYFLDNFFRIIDNWEKEYIDNGGIDFENWELLINYSDNTNKRYYGKGKYPDNFGALENLILEFMSK